MAQSLGIVLTVTTDGNGLFGVTMSTDPNATLPAHTSVSPGAIQLGAATEDVEYSLEFSFSSLLSSEFEFDDTHPILWPYPPGTEVPILFSFGHVTSTSSQCCLPVTVRHFDGQPSHGFAFFLTSCT